MTGTRVYPWDDLKSPGSSFLWPNLRDVASLRAQASKQAKRRSIKITVQVVQREGDPIGILVTYVRGIL